MAHIVERDPEGNIVAEYDGEAPRIGPGDIDLPASIAAAQALHDGATLDEALDIGQAVMNSSADTPATAPQAAPAPAADPDALDELERRYYTARCNLARGDFDQLTDQELIDAAHCVSLPLLGVGAWVDRTLGKR